MSLLAAKVRQVPVKGLVRQRPRQIGGILAMTGPLDEHGCYSTAHSAGRPLPREPRPSPRTPLPARGVEKGPHNNRRPDGLFIRVTGLCSPHHPTPRTRSARLPGLRYSGVARRR